MTKKQTRIFILEDSEDRIAVFESLYGEVAELVIARNADEGISMLNGGEFDLVFLDHDLGGEVYVDSSEHNTGFTVAKNLLKRDQHPIVIIHSWNYHGARNMERALVEGGYRANVSYLPFNTPEFIQINSDIKGQIEEKCENTA